MLAWWPRSSRSDACAHDGRFVPMTGLDALDVDAESQPPYRGAFEKTIEGVAAREGHAIIGKMVVGRPKSLKLSQKH